MTQQALVGIAHAYGNRRHLIDAAIAAGVDMLEADLRYEHGAIWIHHDHPLGLIPVYAGWRVHGMHRAGPHVLVLGPLVLRWDPNPVRLEELLERTRGRIGLLLDLKEAAYPPDEARAFIAQMLRLIDAASFDRPVEFCGSWTLLDLVRGQRPDARTYYSIDRADDWEAVLPRLDSGEVRAASLHCGLADEGRTAVLREHRVRFYCWDIRRAADVRAAAASGGAGIIADDLRLLAAGGEESGQDRGEGEAPDAPAGDASLDYARQEDPPQGESLVSLLPYAAAAAGYIGIGIFVPKLLLSWTEGVVFLFIVAWVVPALLGWRRR